MNKEILPNPNRSVVLFPDTVLRHCVSSIENLDCQYYKDINEVLDKSNMVFTATVGIVSAGPYGVTTNKDPETLSVFPVADEYREEFLATIKNNSDFLRGFRILCKFYSWFRLAYRKAIKSTVPTDVDVIDLSSDQVRYDTLYDFLNLLQHNVPNALISYNVIPVQPIQQLSKEQATKVADTFKKKFKKDINELGLVFYANSLLG